MSIEKLSDCSKVIRQRNPFTQISNEVILNIKDNDAFRVYAYLQSKTAEWKVIKDDVKKMCGIGDRKMDYIFAYLARSNLIRYVQGKNAQNKFERLDIHVLNGLEFNKDEPFLLNKDKKPELSTENEAAPALSAAAETRTRGNAGLLNKDITKEKETKRETKIFKNQKAPTTYVNRETVMPEGVIKAKPETVFDAMAAMPRFLQPKRVKDLLSSNDLIKQYPPADEKISQPEQNLAANWR